ncbi:MAG: outer membrane protein [Gemmatimonadaceae bacterium]
MRHYASRCIAALSALVISISPAAAQATSPSDTAVKNPDAVKRAQLARRGGGLRVGPWHLNGQQEPAGTSSIPALEGFVRTGLDQHLLLENSVGVWRQRQQASTSGGLLGGSTASTDNYIIPQFTSILFYPFTSPNDRLEPFVRGGIGFALGVEDPQSGGGSISFTPGFGLTSGLGVEWRMSEALGLALSTRYQWIRFFQEFGPQQTYQGPVVEAGITYRFQFR